MVFRLFSRLARKQTVQGIGGSFVVVGEIWKPLFEALFVSDQFALSLNAMRIQKIQKANDTTFKVLRVHKLPSSKGSVVRKSQPTSCDRTKSCCSLSNPPFFYTLSSSVSYLGTCKANTVSLSQHALPCRRHRAPGRKNYVPDPLTSQGPPTPTEADRVHPQAKTWG
jgi:hypothetical protein